MVRIYTKTGDKGETSLFTGQRVSKTDPFIEALGTVDECSSAIGAALSFLPLDPAFQKIREELTLVQHTLFDLGAAIATPLNQANNSKAEKTRFDREGVLALEQWIDSYDAQLPELKTFILPGGHPAGAMLNLARSIARRAERIIIPIYNRREISLDVLVYMNRLSDYLFMASRGVNYLSNSPETTWKKHCHLTEKNV